MLQIPKNPAFIFGLTIVTFSLIGLLFSMLADPKTWERKDKEKEPR